MKIIEKSIIVAQENRSLELSSEARALINAIEENNNFDLLETRLWKVEQNKIEIFITELKCGFIKSKNSVGILNRELLAILYIDFCKEHPFRVVPIRESFPEDVLHVNYPVSFIPKNLCMYFESWKEVERRWTFQNFLKRIEWWMLETSKGTIHSNEQQLERPYFESEYKLLLPSSFESLKSTDTYNVFLDEDRKIVKTILGCYQKNCNLLLLEVKPIKHTRVFPFPQSIGELEEQFQQRWSSVVDVLKEEILKRTPASGLPINETVERTFILLKFQRYDNTGNLIGKHDLFAFLVPTSIGDLGFSLGILNKSPTESDRYFNIANLVDQESQNKKIDKSWFDIQIFPIDIVEPLDPRFASSMSGISDEEASFSGILIGVGSLGSTLADIWSKSGWGRWTLFDNDRVASHNVFRHLAKEEDIGRYKSELVSTLMEQNYSGDQYVVSYRLEEFDISQFNNEGIKSKDVNLIVDASASNYLLRDLSSLDELPRSCSLFFNQTGSGGVLFLEDNLRSKRLDFIELNYFRSLIYEEWGENFLQNNTSKKRVGASCSDISVVLSYEKVLLLSSSLSGLLRNKLKSNDASLNILKLDGESGKIDSFSIDLFENKRKKEGDWDIVYDTFIEKKLSRLRTERMPAETGGIVIGYIDHKIKRIYIVDISEEPADSKSSSSGFIRGTDGLDQYIRKIKERTANNCDYIGEWHSHPSGSSSKPSKIDLCSLGEFSKIMKKEGLPILMIIVGEDIGFNTL